jgi:hypothetical protein
VGIVVCVFMLIGLLMALPWVSPAFRVLNLQKKTAVRLSSGLLLAGLWNALWYGLRHPSEFWGIAALVSGFTMIGVAALLLIEQGRETWAGRPWALRSHAVIRPLAIPLMAALAMCFVLYATALVRLNLGLPIIG